MATDRTHWGTNTAVADLYGTYDNEALTGTTYDVAGFVPTAAMEGDWRLMTVDVGDVYSTQTTVLSDGVAVDATAVTCTVTYPDGSTDHLHVDHYGTGLYRSGVRALTPGLHVIDWQATGLYESAYRDSFTAADPAHLLPLSLRQVKAHLNITSTTNDDELRGIIGDVASIGESYTGRVFGRRTQIETHTTTGEKFLLLRACPVLTITEVTVDGETWPATMWRLAPDGGVLTAATVWPYGSTVEVTYTAGYTIQPGADVQGALRLCAHMWKYQRGSVQARGGSWSDDAPFAIPNFVAELWDLNRLPGAL